MVLALCMMFYICVKFHHNIINGIEVTERKLLFEKFKKGHNAKIIQARIIVLVLCILTHDVLYLCKVSWKYHKRYSSYRAETVVCNVQRGKTPKLYKLELWFLHSAYCYMMFYICVKFHEQIMNGFQVIEQKLLLTMFKGA